MIWLNRLFELPAVPLLAFLAAIAAILWLRHSTNAVITRAAGIPSPGQIQGGAAAIEMLRLSEQSDVRVQPCAGIFANFYDPGVQIIRLSPACYEGANLAALGRAAHEVGHALQDLQHHSPTPFAARQALAIAARLCLPTALLLIGVGFVVGIDSMLSLGLWILPAVATLVAGLSYQLERDANRRGRQALTLLDCTDEPRLDGVLNAATWSELDACLPRLQALTTTITGPTQPVA